jgi:hypothetical protein
MPTYYVANYGSNSNNGTSPSTPWQTVGFALGAASGTNPGLIAGDTVWIAPGTYREVITSTTLTGTSGNTIKIYGDPLFTRAWTTGSAKSVRLTNFTTDTALPTQSQTLAVSGDYIEIQDLCIDGHPFGSVSATVSTNSALYLTGGNLSVTNCSVQTTNAGRQVGITWYCTTGKNNFTIDQCSVSAPFGIFVFSVSQTATFNMNAVIKDTFVMAGNDFGIVFEGASANQVTGAIVYNCTVIGGTQGITYANIGAVGGSATVLRNNLVYAPKGLGITSTPSITITQTNNSVLASTNFNNVLPNTNNISAPMFDFGLSRIQQFSTLPWFAPATGSPLIGAGTATGAPSVDLYGNTWTSTPTIGAIESKTESDIGSYQPTERNASVVTIAPASTSQSVELYLGATGLTFATSGLAAYYVRNQSAPVAITLVTQTATGAWTSGGFAEISSSLVPGVYRLDVPDAAFAAGASDVTIVVRGASGTNGAVLTVTLSSGGLTAAQTAAAVWDAATASYVTASTMGARVMKTTVDNRPADVGSSHHIHSNVHAIVDSTAAASELSGALLHNGTDYIDSNLLGGASTRVFVGRFDLRQTGSETVDTIEVFTTDTPSFELQLTDGDGNTVPVTGATLGLRILDVASTVVETGTPTVEYGTGGIVRWTGPGTYLAIGCPVGNYRLFIDRTVSGTTTTFGPLQIRVQAQ